MGNLKSHHATQGKMQAQKSHGKTLIFHFKMIPGTATPYKNKRQTTSQQTVGRKRI